jgi:hypothetical protein
MSKFYIVAMDHFVDASAMLISYVQMVVQRLPDVSNL